MAYDHDYNRAYKAARREQIRSEARAYYAANREAILAKDRAKKAAHTPEQREAHLRYFRQRWQRQKSERAASRPPDAISVLTPTDLAYLAGLVDGEGHLGVTRTRTGHVPLVLVQMTHRPVLKWMADRLAVKVARATIHQPKAHWRPQHRVQVTGRRAGLLLKALAPYLIVKREQAALLAALADTLDQGRRLTPDLIAWRDGIHQQVKHLNRPLPDAPHGGELP